MGDQDFMAALNKAFQETEPSTPAADPDAESTDASDAAGTESGGGEEEQSD